MSYWTKKDLKIYLRMIKRHPKLWERVAKFIDDKKIESVIEVGCGSHSPIKDKVKSYLGIDINKNVDAIHKDFNTMNVSKLPRPDLLLACGVIEHCNGYKDFLGQIKRLRPKYALISFFNKLDRDKDLFMTCTKDDDGEFPWNRYSRKKIIKTLNELGMKHKFIELGRDDLLIIK